VFYAVKVQEERGSGKNSRWVTIYEEDSSQHPFWLLDDTGRVPVLPLGAEVYLQSDLDLQTGLLSWPWKGQEDAVTRFLDGLPGRTRKTLRLSAQIVREGEPVYVLGFASPLEEPQGLGQSVARRLQLSLRELARRLRADPERLRALDKNKDEAIDAQEWEEGLRRLKEELEREASEGQNPNPALIRRSPEGLLVIADKPERELLAALGRYAAWKVLGGPALALASAAYLAGRFGLLGGP